MGRADPTVVARVARDAEGRTVAGLNAVVPSGVAPIAVVPGVTCAPIVVPVVRGAARTAGLTATAPDAATPIAVDPNGVGSGADPMRPPWQVGTMAGRRAGARGRMVPVPVAILGLAAVARAGNVASWNRGDPPWIRVHPRRGSPRAVGTAIAIAGTTMPMPSPIATAVRRG